MKFAGGIRIDCTRQYHLGLTFLVPTTWHWYILWNPNLMRKQCMDALSRKLPVFGGHNRTSCKLG